MTSALDMPEIMSYIYSKSWKLQFSASSSIIIIEDYYLQTFLHSLGFYSSVPARLLFVAVSRDFCYFLKSQIDACPHRISATKRILNIYQFHYLLH